MREKERCRDTGRETGSLRGAWCGTQSQDHGITTWAKGRRSTTEPLRHPNHSYIYSYFYIYSYVSCIVPFLLLLMTLYNHNWKIFQGVDIIIFPVLFLLLWGYVFINCENFFKKQIFIFWNILWESNFWLTYISVCSKRI